MRICLLKAPIALMVLIATLTGVGLNALLSERDAGMVRGPARLDEDQRALRATRPAERSAGLDILPDPQQGRGLGEPVDEPTPDPTPVETPLPEPPPETAPLPVTIEPAPPPPPPVASGQLGGIPLTFYVCTGAPVGYDDGFCPRADGRSIDGSGIWPSPGVAACGDNFDRGVQFTIEGDATGRIYTCADRGYLRPNQVDIYFYDYWTGRAWRNTLDTYVTINLI